MARLVCVPVSLDLWQDTMTEGHIINVKCVDGLPEGAEFVNSFYDGWRRTVCMVFHHESFQDVALEGEMPQLRPVFEFVLE